MPEFIKLPNGEGYWCLKPTMEQPSQPEPEPLPPHVNSNLDLQNSIEAEYLNRGREFKKLFRTPKTTSSFALIRIHHKPLRDALFDELAEFQRFLDKREPKKVKPPQTCLQDAGQSIVRARECMGEIYAENH